jgi:phosphatidate cytidylyltransferase
MLLQRFITAVILIPVVLAFVFFAPNFHFTLFVGSILTIAAWEWGNLANFSRGFKCLYAAVISIFLYAAHNLSVSLVLIVSGLWWAIAFVLVVIYPKLDQLWGRSTFIALIGVIVLVSGFVSLSEVKRYEDGNYLICLLFFLIWGADVGAYFLGRLFGVKKLVPRVSPGKSWAGLYGGLSTSLVIAVLMAIYFGRPGIFTLEGVSFLGLCVSVSLLSILGDLTISMFKRHRGVKDSSNLLPGHGGFLDRIDSLLSASPAFVCYLSAAGWVVKS